MKRITKVPERSFLVAADVVGLYQAYHTEGIQALNNKLQEKTQKFPLMFQLVQPSFFLKINIFVFNNEVKQHIFDTAIEAKFASPYAYIYMNKTE